MNGGSSQSHRARRQCPVFLPPPFFPTLLSPLHGQRNCARHPFSPFSPLAPFFLRLSLLSLSLVISLPRMSPLCSALPLLLFMLFFLSLSLSLFLYPSLFPLYFLLSLPMFSVLLLLLYLHSSQRTDAHFFLLPIAPTLIHVDICERRTNRPTDDCPRESEKSDKRLSCPIERNRV